ncbi:MAG: hypothetical protein NC337_00535 [Roseburia sp.]|nr:hypothetical protein [Roseburia sp.]
MDANTAYFLKKYYPHVIKWWLVVYIPEVVRIWPSKAEEEEALRLEAQQQPALEQHDAADSEASPIDSSDNMIDESAYNATTGSYSGLYGQKPVDADTQAALDAILNGSNNQNSVDMLLSGGSKTVVLPPEQDEIIAEANAIYERLLREAAEDEAKKRAEIDAARTAYDEQNMA